MRKVLTILGLLFIIIIVSCQLVFPWLAQQTMETRLQDKLATHEVQLVMDTTPKAFLALGRIDHLSVVAHQAKIGKVYVKELTLTGNRLAVDMPALLQGERLSLKAAETLEMKGLIDAEGIRAALARELEQLDNLQVDIKPEVLLVTANLKIFGRVADVEMEGKLTENQGALYFIMTKLQMKNTRIGTAKLGDWFGNIQLSIPQTLPLDLKIKQVTQQDGLVVITAQREEKN